MLAGHHFRSRMCLLTFKVCRLRSAATSEEYGSMVGGGGMLVLFVGNGVEVSNACPALHYAQLEPFLRVESS